MVRAALRGKTRRFLAGSPAPGAPLLLWPLTQSLLAAAKGAVSFHSLSYQQRQGDIETLRACVCVNASAVDDMGCIHTRKLLPVNHGLGFAWLP